MEDKKRKILVIDDDENLRLVLSDKLSISGFEVATASNGKEGLDKALELHPDVTLLDILMPIMDGWEMLDNLRKDDWGKKAKVIMLTGVEDAEAVAKAVQGGSFAYILKTDLSMNEIAEKIKEMLQ
jgi:CheY-like chemotaxis protein